MAINIINTEQFAELRQSFGYYVDKTRFLIDFLQDPTNPSRFRSPGSGTLFTRPRRFGKTLFMSMLAEFFDIKKQGNGQNLFEGLAVSSNEKLCQEWMHQYPVISITLKGVCSSTFPVALERIEQIVSEICDKNNELLESAALDSQDRKLLKQLRGMEAKTSTLANALFLLTKFLDRHYGKKVILLIDEYDVPVATAAEKGYYGEMLEFMRDFLSDALKTNPHLNFAILTGALHIAALPNNVDSFDISSHRHADIFGFTQAEVDTMLAKAGCEERRDIIREWYDGYHFGDRTDMYCPWSIMRYLSDQCAPDDEPYDEREDEPKAWWAETSSNEILGYYGKRLGEVAYVRGQIAALLAGNPVGTTINPCLEYTDVVKGSYSTWYKKHVVSERNFWTMLYQTGYLTKVKDSEELLQVYTDDDDFLYGDLLVIPNRDARVAMMPELVDWVKKILPESQRAALYGALWEQDVRAVEKALSHVLEGCSIPCVSEACCHGMMYLVLWSSNIDTRSGMKFGHGHHDIVVPEEWNSRAAILEIRRVSSEDQLDAGVRKALEQMAERDCGSELPKEEYKSLLRAVIAFCGKSVKVGFAEVRGKVDSTAS